MRASLDAAAVAVRAGLDGDVLHVAELDVTQPHRSYQVGLSPTADLPLPIPPLALLQVVDDRLELRVPEGFLATEPFGERVPATQSVRLRWRSIEILITPSTPAHSHRLKPRRSWPLELLSGTAATIVGLLALMPAALMVLVSAQYTPDRVISCPVHIVFDASGPRSPAKPRSQSARPKGADRKLETRRGSTVASFDPQKAAQRSGILGLLDSHSRFGATAEGVSSGGSAFDQRSVFDDGSGTDARRNLDHAGDLADETYSVGGLGLVGSGEAGDGIGIGTVGTLGRGDIGIGSGYGRGEGGLGGRRASVPDVVPGSAQVRGALDKEMIRRVIRRHLNEVRYCYEQALQKAPELSGRVSVKFVIRPDGVVAASDAQENTLADPSVAECTARAFLRWQFFNVPGGGIVIVSYPFDFRPAGT